MKLAGGGGAADRVATMLGWAALAFVAGAVAGSFVTVLAHRIPRGRGIRARAARAAPRCGEQIAAYDNVPIVSWLALRGRCRNCGEPISPRYPLAEAGARARCGRERCWLSGPTTRASSCSGWCCARC